MHMSRKGTVPWNKGLTEENDERVKRMSEKMRKSLKGKPLTEEHRKNLYRNGRVAWNKGKHVCSEAVKKAWITRRKKYNLPPPKLRNHKKRDYQETRKRMLENNPMKNPEVVKKKVATLKEIYEREPERKLRGDKSSSKRPEVKEKIRQAMIKNIQEGKFKWKITQPEKKLNKLLQEYFPNEWKYTGDGYTWIGGKCPDFLNVNGQKAIIEMFGDYWHGEKRTGKTKEESEGERIKHFAKYGFKCLVIWQHELKNENEVRNKIKGM